MSNNSAPSHWIRTKATLTNEVVHTVSAKEFIHPADAIDKFGDEQAEVLAREMFVRMLMLCIPQKAHGVDRKKVGFKRMCVLVYITSPQFFNGMTKRELAAYLEITPRALRQEFNNVKRILQTTNGNANV